MTDPELNIFIVYGADIDDGVAILNLPSESE